MKAEQRITNALLAWYQKHHRTLPWRSDPSPYHVWISEIMLQQTRVEAVKAYYERFLEELPDIASLANAPEDRLLKLWEGLGYYSRARNLKKAAQVIVSEFGGIMPDEAKVLKTLPGIGDYTAAAVASIAFGKREAVVDGNVLRVMARLRGDSRDILLSQTKKQVQTELYENFLPKEAALCGTFNQALMELGALVCVPNGAPHCEKCPVKKDCAAAKAGTQADYPVKSEKKRRRVEKRTVLLLSDHSRIAIRKRENKGLLAGLYEYPSLEGHITEAALRTLLRKQGIPALKLRPLPDAKHIFTHREWHMKGFLVETEEMEAESFGEGLFFADRRELETIYAIPSAFRVYTACAKERLPVRKP